MGTQVLNYKGREVCLRTLDDGTNRVCIHWLISDPNGPVDTRKGCTPHLLDGSIVATTRGRIACNPKQTTVRAQEVGDKILVCSHTADVRAATCPKCLESPEALELLKKYSEAEKPAA